MKTDDVSTVVLTVLAAGGRPTDDLSKVMGADLLYALDTIPIFLDKVSSELKTFTPRYTFKWPPPSASDALGYSVAVLIYNIDQNTTQP